MGRNRKARKGEFRALAGQSICLQNLYVFCLEAFRPLNDVELDCLAFLKAPETVRLNCRKVHEDILAILAADKSKSLGVVKPLHCSLFHCVYTFFFCVEFSAEKIGCY
jgi:hypothetical protein